MENPGSLVISLASSSNSFVLTDACFEPENESWKCGLGGILVDMMGRAAQYFSLCLSDEQIGDLGGSSKKTIIFEAEMVAVILAIRLWMERIRHAMVICFIENNSARVIAISASGRSNFAMALVEVLLQSEHRGSFFLGMHVCRPRLTRRIVLLEIVMSSLTNINGVSRCDASTLTAAVISEVLEAKKSNSG